MLHAKYRSSFIHPRGYDVSTFEVVGTKQELVSYRNTVGHMLVEDADHNPIVSIAMGVKDLTAEILSGKVLCEILFSERGNPVIALSN